MISLEPETKRIVVGPYEALAKPPVLVKEVHWLIDPKLFEQAYPCQVKIRSTHQPVAATIQALKK